MTLSRAEQERRKAAKEAAQAEAGAAKGAEDETATKNAESEGTEIAGTEEETAGIGQSAEGDDEGWDGVEGTTPLSPPPPAVAPAESGIDLENAPDRPNSSDEEDDSGDDLAQGDPGDEPLAKEWVVLDGPASFGPVIVGGKRVTILKNKLYYVPDVEERADILATGRFRGATHKDLVRAGQPSAGPGGAITRDMLPPGALKGGLTKP